MDFLGLSQFLYIYLKKIKMFSIFFIANLFLCVSRLTGVVENPNLFNFFFNFEHLVLMKTLFSANFIIFDKCFCFLTTASYTLGVF